MALQCKSWSNNNLGALEFRNAGWNNQRYRNEFIESLFIWFSHGIVYAYAAGIRPLEAGFGKVAIAPHPDVRISEIACSYDSVSGRYVCNWKIGKDGTFTVHVEVPFNCEAVVELPGYEKAQMTLSAGSYDFSYEPKEDLRKPYGRNTTLARIAKDGQAMGILGKYTPALAGIAASGDLEMGANSLEDLSHMGFLPFDPAALETAIGEISNIVVE